MALDLRYFVMVGRSKVEISNCKVAAISNYRDFQERFLAVYLNIVESGYDNCKNSGFMGPYRDPSTKDWRPSSCFLEKYPNYDVEFSFGGQREKPLTSLTQLIIELCSGRQMVVHVHEKAQNEMSLDFPD